MKHQGGLNTPKTLAELKKEKNKYQARLDQLLGLARETRLQNKHTNIYGRRTIEEIREAIRDIDLILEQKGTDKQKDIMPTAHSPPKSDKDNATQLQFNLNLPKTTSGNTLSHSDSFVIPQKIADADLLHSSVTSTGSDTLISPRFKPAETDLTRDLANLEALKTSFPRTDFDTTPGRNIFGRPPNPNRFTETINTKTVSFTNPH